MSSPDINDINTRLSPAVLTSNASLLGGAANRDDAAVRLLGMMNHTERPDIGRNSPDAKKSEDLYRFSSTYGTAVWVRNKITDGMFEALKMLSFLDLGCGVTQRGLRFADRRYIRYYGLDLPPIIDKMSRVMSSVIKEKKLEDRIIYRAVDVTDLKALKSVIRGREPLFIATDGLMMYLTESEMQTVVKNIASLLADYGGVWFTGDPSEKMLYWNIIKSVPGFSEESIKGIVGTELSEKWRKLIFENSFVACKNGDPKAMLAEYGLNCTAIHPARFVERLDIQENIKTAFENSNFFEITAMQRAGTRLSEAQMREFDITFEEEDGALAVFITGRLDSLTAPELIEKYNEKCGENIVPTIIDMRGCAYLSSAGIRALLMLYKKNHIIKNGFQMRNIVPEVLEILEVTGFTEFFSDV